MVEPLDHVNVYRTVPLEKMTTRCTRQKEGMNFGNCNTAANQVIITFKNDSPP